LKRFNISGAEAIRNFVSILFYKPLEVDNFIFHDGQNIGYSQNLSGIISVPEEISAPISFKITISSVFNKDYICSIEKEIVKLEKYFQYKFKINIKKKLNHGFYTLRIECKTSDFNYINSFSFLCNI